MRLSLVLTSCLSGEAIRRKAPGTLSGPAVSTTFGDVVGTNNGRCDSWLGIPFAKPPVGDRRFANPEPWSDSYPASGRNAQSAGEVCVSMNAPVIGSGGVEDCLFLNVWRPQGVKAGDNLPVMVYVHGGAFMMGASTEDPYEGCHLSSNQNVIMASMNYRLNMFGWGSFENDDGSIDSNWGLEDQREALRWLRRELHAFGGDSEKITLFGESAGGISIWAHMVSPASQGLFRAAMPISGLPAAKDTPAALNATRDMGRRLDCNNEAELRACLRTKDPSLIMEKDDQHDFFQADTRLFQRWEPVGGTPDLPDHPYKMLVEGKSHKIPLLHGSNTDEGTFFTYLLYLIRMNDRFYEDLIRTEWQNIPGNPSMNMNDEEVNRVLTMYPAVGGFRADNRRQYAEQATDVMFACATRFGGRHHAQHSPTWTYLFNYRSEACPPPPVVREAPGVFHGMGLAFLFNNTDCVPEPEAVALTSRKQKYFANFAKYLDPNGESATMWPRYEAGTQEEIILQGEDAIQTFYKQETVCPLWEDVLYSKVL